MLPPGSNHEAFFKCERCGESWSAPISVVTKWNRTLCKKCSMGDNGLQWTKRATRQNGSLEEKFPELAKQWDVKKNGSLKPYDIPSNYSKGVYWKCADCGYEWQQSPSSRIHKDRISGCPHCSGRVAMPGVDDLETLFPEIAREWDYSKNNGIPPSQVRPHSSKSRYWICSKHNIEFKTSPANRVRGCGCRLCKSEKIVKKQGFRIERYTKSLDYIKTYSSLNEAARDLKISVEAIRQAALTGALSFDSYWKYEGTDFKVLKPDKKHPVISINIKTGEKVEYESAREAEKKTGVGHSRIMKCCRGEPKYKTAGGYKWEFKQNK